MSDFWTSEKGYKVYKNGPIGRKVLEQKCPEDCVSVKMGDGTCDQECNTIACLWDGDDCDGVLPEGISYSMCVVTITLKVIRPVSSQQQIDVTNRCYTAYKHIRLKRRRKR